MGYLEFLTEKDIYRIHLNTLRILEETGVVFQNEKALKIFDEAGCIVDYKKQLVKIPSYLVEECIKKAIHNFTLYGRDPKYKAEFGARKTYFMLKVGPTQFYDFETGEYRQCTTLDLVKVVRLANVLSECDVVPAYLAPPSDVPIEVNDLYQNLITMRNTVKPTRGHADNLEAFNDYVSMLCILHDREEDELKKHPLLPGASQASNHPLFWGKEMINIIMRTSELGLLNRFSAGGMMGSDIPVTLGGAIIMSNAELLSCYTLAKLVNPRAPIILAGTIRTFDMRDLYVGFGDAENAIAHACHAQIMRYYGIPSETTSIQDSNTEDEQAGYAKMMKFAIPSLAGVSLTDGIGSLAAENLFSLGQMVIDNEIIQLVKRLQDKLFNGIGLRDEELAVDLIKKVGPRGSFLKEKHTRDHYRSTIWFPPLGKRMRLEPWIKAGKPSYAKKGFNVAEQMLKDAYIPELPKNIDKELVKVIKEAEKREVGKR